MPSANRKKAGKAKKKRNAGSKAQLYAKIEEFKRPSFFRYLFGERLRHAEAKRDDSDMEKFQSKISDIESILDSSGIDVPGPEGKNEFSRLFHKCRKLIGKSIDCRNNGKIEKAKRLYQKAKKAYDRVPFDEKKELHKDMDLLYESLVKQ
ncbi:hypothetical protein J4212_07350 [Candidatus Woesearchaeota archaeon]|nr:hypothetical protein [Candidatus Woesearchaeota archaeon]